MLARMGTSSTLRDGASALGVFALGALLASGLATVLGGCNSPATPPPADAGGDAPALDGGEPLDGAATDSGGALDAELDAASPDDTGSAGDAGAAADAGSTDDASAADDAGGTPTDAGPSATDAGPGATDAGPPTDAGPDATDAGSPRDAGPGVDAPITTCTIMVAPSSAPESGTLTFTGASNGAMCTATVDALASLVVPCTATMDFVASTFGVGDHVIELAVGAGPAGPTSCSATFAVTADPPATTSCSILVVPESGTASTVYTASWTSDGTTCSFAVDGLGLGTVPCTGSYMSDATPIGPGTHTASLNANGPGGPTTCSDTFVVTP